MPNPKAAPAADAAPAPDAGAPDAQGGIPDKAVRPQPFKDKITALREATDDDVAAVLAGELEDEDPDELDEEAAAATAAAAAGTEEDDDDPEAVAAAAAAADPAAAAAAAAAEAGDDDDFVIVSLPPRAEGDEDFELPLDIAALEAAGIDPAEAVERINQLRNGAMRRKEFDAAADTLQAEKDEIDGIFSAMDSDPAGFLSAQVAPELQGQVAEKLLLELSEAAFQKLVRKIDSFSRDPASRTTAATKAENARLKADADRRRSAETSDEVTKQVREIGTSIRNLVPESMSEEKAKRFVRAAASELKRHANENKLKTLDPAKVPELLGSLGVLEDFGVSANGDGSASPGGAPNPPKKGVVAKKKAAVASVDPEKQKGDVRERLRRRKSAASTPAGAGSAAPAGFTKVPGEDYKTRRNRLARAIGVKEKK